MKKLITTGAAAFAAFAVPGSLPAHHSLVLFDTSAPLWVKGSFVRIDRINPHSRIFIDQVLPDSSTQRWAVDSPDPRRLERMGVDQDFFEPGDVLEFCGFTMREEVIQERVRSGANLRGRFMNGNLLVMPDGEKWRWSDYGQLRLCVSEEELETLRR